MTGTFTYITGSSPLLISMPHNGSRIPDDIAATMVEEALNSHDTDWYLDRLYDFAPGLGAHCLIPEYSRYVIDLNRDPAGTSLYPGQDTTELCPTSSFQREPVYKDGQAPDENEIARRIESYWQPYHQQLASALMAIKAQHGFVVLLEAHSIASHVPRFFEGQLPDFNFGTNSGESCDTRLSDAVMSLDVSGYSRVINARFKGGYITRHYGRPSDSMHSIQLELSQATYMNEETLEYAEAKANQVKVKLRELTECLLSFNPAP